jgi:hypothetical protein
LPSVALLLSLVEEVGCCGVGTGSAHENTVNIVGPLVDRGRDASEAGEELDRSGSANSDATFGRSGTVSGWSSPAIDVPVSALRMPSFDAKSR